MHKIHLTQQNLHQRKSISDLIDEKRFRVAIFWSARVKPEEELYKEVSHFAHTLAQKGYDIVTGWWPGLMEAASIGHHTGCENPLNTKTIGINIQLPWEQSPNPYLDVSETSTTFSERLDTFMLLSDVFVVTPGGIWTLLELFYTWQLMQVHHICKVPIILWWDAYGELKKFVQNSLVKEWYLNSEEADLAIHAKNRKQVLGLIDIAYESYETLGEKACVNIRQYIAWAKNLWLIDS